MPTSRLVERRIDPLARQLLDQHLHVRGRDHDDVWLQVLDQLHLLLGLAARHRNHGAAGALRTVVRAQAACEEAVAVGDVDHVAGPAAGGADRARDQVGPGIDVVQRVADDRGLAGRSGRGVDARDTLARHGEHAERVVVAQVGLDRERELGQVGELFQVAGMDALGVERAPVVGDVVVGVPDAPLHALELQRAQLVDAGALDRLELSGKRTQRGHAGSFVTACGGMTVRSPRRAERPRTRATRTPCWLVTIMS